MFHENPRISIVSVHFPLGLSENHGFQEKLVTKKLKQTCRQNRLNRLDFRFQLEKHIPCRTVEAKIDFLILVIFK